MLAKRTLCGICCVGFAGLIAAAEIGPDTDGTTAGAPGAADSREAQLLSIAQKFHAFTRINKTERLAPQMCRGPATFPKLSASSDSDTHGHKLYFLWVEDPTSYAKNCGVTREGLDALVDIGSEDNPFEPRPSDKKQDWSTEPAPCPVGQTLVKESFEAREVRVPGASPAEDGPSKLPEARAWPLVFKDGHAYESGSPHELFIMTKVDPRTPDTDNGWIYAVVSTDRKAVLQSGRIESCMHCHDQTSRDRLYGPEETWPKDKNGTPTLPLMSMSAKTKPLTAPSPPASKESVHAESAAPSPAGKP